VNHCIITRVSHCVNHFVERGVEFEGFFGVKDNCVKDFVEFFLGANLADGIRVNSCQVTNCFGFTDSEDISLEEYLFGL